MRRFTRGMAAMLLLSTWLATMPVRSASSFADPAFQQQWTAGEAITPNFWGPLSLAHDGQQEPYKEAQGGQRLVQYFDKGRMELTNGVVTNGLLATELIKGQMQVGDATFQPMAPPNIPIAGDPDNPGPTYAGLSTAGAFLFAPAAPIPLGYTVTTTVDAGGNMIPGGNSVNSATTIAAFDAVTKHNVPGGFAQYRERVGLAAIGYAISEPFLAKVKVAGAGHLVMVQVFERRVLTYTAENPDPYKVEMGNISQHYYQWRYGSTTPQVVAPSVTSSHVGPSDLYPDPSLTPGDVFPNVTANEICVSGYSASVRSVSSTEKRAVAARYGYTGPSSEVEYDHFIALELGGSNAVTNLWPERYVTADAPGQIGAREKDKVENALHAAVCRGDITLQHAQEMIRTDWYAVYLSLAP